MRRIHAALFALSVLMFAVAFGAADDISRLYNFTSGTTIQSSQVNGEFNQLITTMNSKFGRGVANTVTGSNTFSGANTFSGITTFSEATTGIKTDKINEYTSTNGVTVDGTLLKDGYIRPNLSSDPTTVEGNLWYNSTGHLLKFYDGTNTKTVATSTDIGFPKGYLNGPPVAYVTAAQVKIPSGFKARNSTNTADMTASANKTCDLTVSGAGGLDSGAEASNTWYYVYFIQKSSDSTNACLLSTVDEAVTGAVTLPSGYDLKRQLPIAIRNDGSSNIIPFIVVGSNYLPWVIYDVAMDGTTVSNSVLAAGTATTFTDISLSSYVPPISRFAKLYGSTSTVGGNYLYLLKKGSSHAGKRLSFNGANFYVESDIETDTSQVIQYKVTSGNASIGVLGFCVTEVY